MPIGIDIFSGAGGLSLGAEMAGFQVRFAVEKDKSAARTYRYNHPNTLVLEDDIHNINPHDYLLPDEHVSIVFGGPPCQGFSFSNTMSRNMENPNNSLFGEFLRFVNEIQPDWFLFENVEGFAHFEKGRIQLLVEERFRKMEYSWQYGHPSTAVELIYKQCKMESKERGQQKAEWYCLLRF
jgi:DNA (cytosine-5)-methyltransferase 1